MTQPRIVTVSRDEHGIRYDEPATGTAEKPASSKPVRVRSKKAAEKLGWTISGETEHVREVPGTPYLEKVPGAFQAEWVGSFRGDPPRAHRKYAATLPGLLKAIEQFEQQRKAGGAHG